MGNELGLDGVAVLVECRQVESDKARDVEEEAETRDVSKHSPSGCWMH